MLIMFDVDIFLVSEVSHLVIEFECFDRKKKFSNNIIIFAITGENKELSDELYFFDSLNDFVRTFEFGDPNCCV